MKIIALLDTVNAKPAYCMYLVLFAINFCITLISRTTL